MENFTYKANRLSFLTALLFGFLIFSSCNRDIPSGNVDIDQEINSQNKPPDTLDLPLEQEIEPELKITYHRDSLETAGNLDSLFAQYGEDQKRIIYAINRIEPVRVGVGTNLILPDTLLQDLMDYAPFPRKMSIINTLPKSVLINQRTQAFALYEKGELIHWGPVSSGKKSTPTPNGLHYGNYKAKHKISTVNSDWELPYYFNFMNFEGVGVHQYLLPGFPASHACVRLYMEDAKYIYDWAHQWKLDPTGNRVVRNGTPFMVFGEYNYEEEAPWLQLSGNSKFTDLTEAELETLKNYVQQYLEDEKNFEQTTEGDEENSSIS